VSSLLFPSILVLIGAYSMAAQIFFIRELLVQFFGSELCLGLIFFCWFLGIAAGAWVAGRFCKTLQHPLMVFLPSLVILTITPFIVIPLMRGLRSIMIVAPGEYISLIKMIAGAGMTVCPFSFLIGILFPIACRAAERQEAGSAAVGLVYVWESVGSLLGGLIISLVVIPAYRPLPVFGSIAGIIWAASFWFFLKRYEDRLSKTIISLLLVLSVSMLVLLSAGTIAKFDDYLVRLRWDTFHNRYQLLASRDSRYQNLVLAKSADQYGIFADGQFISSYPDEYQSTLKAHLFMCQHPAPERVLLIGDGLTGIVRNILQHNVKIIDYIEIDTEMVSLVRPILAVKDKSVLADQRVNIIYKDGRQFVKGIQRTYDLIIVNTPEPTTAALNRFYTVDFFGEVKNALAEGGVMVIGLSASSNYLGGIISNYAASLYDGLKNVFPYTLVIPQEDKSYFFAAIKPDLLTPDYRVLQRRYQERGIQSEVFPAELFRVLVQKERIESMTSALNRNTGASVNTDMQPITYFYQLLLWEIFTGGQAEAAIFQTVTRYIVFFIVAVLVIFCLARSLQIYAATEKSVRYFNCLWAIGTTGCTGMALELVLIFMFQNMYGYIYQMIGIIAGSFMFGLTAGGYSIKRLIASGRPCGTKALLACEIALCVYAVLLPFALSGLNMLREALQFPVIDVTACSFMVLVFIAGFIAGLEFPLVSHILISHNNDIVTAAGRVDAVDHLGACAGSLLTGALLVPLAGVYQACFIMGLLNASSVLFIVMQIRVDKN